MHQQPREFAEESGGTRKKFLTPQYMHVSSETRYVPTQTHTNTHTCTNRIDLSSLFQGKFDEAAPLYRRAMAITETIFGTGHPDYARRLNNLADLLFHQVGATTFPRLQTSDHPDCVTARHHSQPRPMVPLPRKSMTRQDLSTAAPWRSQRTLLAPIIRISLKG